MMNLDFFGAIEAVVVDKLERLEVALPARIERYFPEEQRAHVKPLVHYVMTDGQGLAKYTEPLPIICGVPVVFFSVGGYSLTAPVNVGDFVLLVFSSESLAEWLTNDGRDVDPKDPRRHDINDAIAIPGLRPFSKALPSAQLNHLSLGKEGGLRIHIKENEVCLGEENPSDAVALAAKVEAQLAALKEAITTAATGTQDGGALFKTNILAALSTWPEDVGSSTVKVKP
jgi:hypothetical protein